MSEFLSSDDLELLTGYARPAEQRRVLCDQGIPFKAMGGRTIVLRSHIHAWIEGRRIPQHAEPNLAAVR